MTQYKLSRRTNGEGYSDPTASVALGLIRKEEQEEEQEVRELIKTVRSVIRLAGYELENRICVKSEKSGRIYK